MPEVLSETRPQTGNIAPKDFLPLPEISNPSPAHAKAMRHLIGVVQALSQAHDIAAIAAIVRDAARSLTGADGATFVLRDGDKCYYADENAIAPLWKGKRFPMEMCISGWVMLNARPAVIPDIYADPRIPAEAYRPTFVKSLAMVPIRRAAPIGAIGNYWAANREPSEEELAILQALADTTSVALENAHLYESLRDKVQRLEVQQERIRGQHESLEVFTRALAHDLKEPVRTVRAFTDLIAAEDSLGAANREYFEFIRKSADRMAMLVDTVFLYTQLDDPERMVKAPVAMQDVLRAARDNLDQLIRERQVHVTMDALPQVEAHAAHMMQMLQNLIANAIRHGPPGVCIHVSAEELGDQWLFRVRDNGPGLGPADSERIFQPFRRLNQNEEGAGLGLPICRKIITLHGGRIWCESQPGAGADFLFTLPRHTRAPAKNAIKEIVMTPSTTLPQHLANVLLIDDRKADIELTRVFLQVRDKMKFNLKIANGAKEALETLKQAISRGEVVDLLLLDINMPGMDGFELLEEMRKDPALKTIAVVMCTGSTYDQDQARARALGAAGYMVKPASLEQLKPMLVAIPALKLDPEGDGVRLMRAA